MTYHCQPERVGITMGSVNEETVKGALPKKVDVHIFVGESSKPGWYELPEDHTQRFPKFTPPFQKKIDAWKQVFLAPGLG